MYNFNMLKFNRIIQYRDKNNMRVCLLADIPLRTLQHWSNDYTKIPVWGIVAICNAVRISIAYLLDNKDDNIEEDLDYSIEQIPEDKFKPLVYNKEAIKGIYDDRDGRASITKKAFISKMGVYDGTVNNWIRNEKALRLATLIDICNTFELDINKFIIDPNKHAFSPTKDASSHVLSALHQMQTELRKLKTDNLLKRTIISSMKKEMEELKEMHLFEKQKLLEMHPIASVVAEGSVPYGLFPNANSTSSMIRSNDGKSTKTRYVFNKYLFKSLPTLSGLSIDAISSLCKLSPTYIEEGSDEFRVSRLVALCNRLHISIRHFFLLEGEFYIVGRPDDYFSDAVCFKHINFCPDNIASLAGSDGGVLGVSRSYFCDSIGISSSVLSQWIKDEKQSSLSINGLLRICNAYHIAPDMFFNDPNSQVPSSYPISAEDILFTENLMLKKHIKEQKKIIEEFQNKNINN